MWIKTNSGSAVRADLIEAVYIFKDEHIKKFAVKVATVSGNKYLVAYKNTAEEAELLIKEIKEEVEKWRGR